MTILKIKLFIINILFNPSRVAILLSMFIFVVCFYLRINNVYAAEEEVFSNTSPAFSNTSPYFLDFCQERYGTRHPTVEQVYRHAGDESLEKLYRSTSSKLASNYQLQRLASMHVNALFDQEHERVPDIGSIREIRFNTILPFYLNNPTVLINQYGTILNNVQNEQQLMIESFYFVERLIPPQMWAITPEELLRDDSIINCFLDQLNARSESFTDLQHVHLLYLRLSISIYNSMLVQNKDIYSNIDLAHQVFMSELERLFTKKNV